MVDELVPGDGDQPRHRRASDTPARARIERSHERLAGEVFRERRRSGSGGRDTRRPRATRRRRARAARYAGPANRPRAPPSPHHRSTLAIPTGGRLPLPGHYVVGSGRRGPHVAEVVVDRCARARAVGAGGVREAGRPDGEPARHGRRPDRQPGTGAAGDRTEPARRVRLPLRRVAAGSGPGRRTCARRSRQAPAADGGCDRALLHGREHVHRCGSRTPPSTPTTRSRSCRATCTARRARSTTPSGVSTTRSPIRLMSSRARVSRSRRRIRSSRPAPGHGSTCSRAMARSIPRPGARRSSTTTSCCSPVTTRRRTRPARARTRRTRRSRRAATPRTSPIAGSTTQLRVSTGGATNVDILDRHKSGFAGSCARTEGTFSVGGGGFIANKSGPVRAIRSYLGANSGTYTQRDEIMYEGRMDVTTYLRVPPDPAAARLDGLQRGRDRHAVRHEHEHRGRHHRRSAGRAARRRCRRGRWCAARPAPSSTRTAS